MPTQVQGLGLVDDQGNKSIVVNLSNARQMTNAEYQQLTPAQRNGAIIVTDFPIPEESDSVSVTADGVKTYGTLLSELFALTDTSKITKDTKLKIGSFVLHIDDIDVGAETYRFERINALTTSYAILEQLGFRNSPYYRTVTLQTNGITLSDTLINGIPADGIVITLHYGTSSQIINVLTDADHCMMSDGITSVEDTLDDKVSKSGDTMTGNLAIDTQSGTTSTTGYSRTLLGNNIPQGTDKNSRGELFIYDKSQYYARLRCGDLTDNRNIDLPNKSGTIALTDDTMPVPKISGGTLLTTIASSDAGANVTATKNGYICGVYYTTGTGGILKGKIRDSTYPTYGTSFYVDQILWAGEPFFCIPVKKGHSFAINVSGHSEVKIYQF